MKAVEEALLDDFNHWLNESGKADGSFEDRLSNFMKDKFATTVATENIFETIKTMNSPPTPNEETADESAVLQHVVACAGKLGQGDGSSRKKRSTEGKRLTDLTMYDNAILIQY